MAKRNKVLGLVDPNQPFELTTLLFPEQELKEIADSIIQPQIVVQIEAIGTIANKKQSKVGVKQAQQILEKGCALSETEQTIYYNTRKAYGYVIEDTSTNMLVSHRIFDNWKDAKEYVFREFQAPHDDYVIRSIA